jgi:hypothetical protein
MALLDTDHNYNYSGIGGDVLSTVVPIASIDPADTAPVELSLSKWEPERAQPPTRPRSNSRR